MMRCLQKIGVLSLLITANCAFAQESAPTSIDRVFGNPFTSVTTAGGFTMTNSSVLHFLEVYFYSDTGCSTLMSNGVASFLDNGAGMNLSGSQTYNFNPSSIFQLADNRGVTTGSIACIKVYMDGGNATSNGINCLSFQPQTCSGSTCTTSASAQSATWGAAGSTPTICLQRNAYISQGSNFLQCAVDASTGAVSSSCNTTALANLTLGSAFNNGYGYFSNANQVSYYSLNPSNAGLSSQGTTGGSISGAKGIAVSGTYAYIVGGSGGGSPTGALYTCSISSSTGALTCADSGIDSLHDPRGIAINNGFAYISNNAGNTISQCTVSGSSVSSCTTAAMIAGTPPVGIAAYNGFLYIVTNGFSGITGATLSCPINSDGSLGSCVDTGACNGASCSAIFNTPQGITINNNFAYIASTGNNSLVKCTVNPTAGTLSSCASTGPVVNAPVGISIY